MKKVIIALLVLTSCNTNPTKPDLSASIDSASIHLTELTNRIHTSDSMKLVSMKMCFAAGYKKGCSTGINNPDATIPQLYERLAKDSAEFAKVVDHYFK